MFRIKYKCLAFCFFFWMLFVRWIIVSYYLPNVKKEMKVKESIPLTVLLSRMRSGSTFLGDLFKVSPRSFYIFEPMHYTALAVGNEEILFMNGTRRNYSRGDLPQIQAEMMKNWLTCDLEDIDFQTFKSSHFMYYTKLGRIYSCQKKFHGNRTAVLKECLPWLKKKCEIAASRTLKVISADVHAIEILLNITQEVRVIHLVRDPRAVLQSQISIRQIKKENIERESEFHCSDVGKSLAVAARIRKQGGKVHLLRYEDLASDPLIQLGKVYKFSRMKLVLSITEFVHSIALKKGRTNSHCKFCSNKGDSVKASLRWRLSIPFDIMLKIQYKCLDLLDSLGYITVDTASDLTNLKMSLVEK